jgi:hypothetical protein
MKKIFLSIAFLMAVTMAFSQATTKVQTDTLRIFQVGGHTAEIVIENSTKNVTGGFLQNKGNGRTQFAMAVDSVYQDSSGLHLRKGNTWTNITFPNAILYTGSGGVNVNSTTKEITAPGKVDYISMRNDSLFYNKGGVEYYAGKTNAIAPAWGTLSGTLSDQTDLQDALDTITDSLVLKLRISDTASMLSKYLRKADTATLDARIRAIKITQDSLTFSGGLERFMNDVTAKYYVPMWNANRIQGYYVDAGRPGNGYFLGFDSSNGIYRAMKPDSVVGAGPAHTLQQVTDAGNTTTNTIDANKFTVGVNYVTLQKIWNASVTGMGGSLQLKSTDAAKYATLQYSGTAQNPFFLLPETGFGTDTLATLRNVRAASGVSYSNGYGLNLATSVFSVDTFSITTRAYRKKGLDSLAALISSGSNWANANLTIAGSTTRQHVISVGSTINVGSGDYSAQASSFTQFTQSTFFLRFKMKDNLGNASNLTEDGSGFYTDYQKNGGNYSRFQVGTYIEVASPDVRITTLPVYADNAAATAAGLSSGQLYKTSTGQVMVKY